MSNRAVRAILPRPLRALINDNDRIWKLLASRRTERQLEAGVLHSRATRPFADIDSRSLSQTVVTALLEPWRHWDQREKIAVFTGRAFIEPAGGWIICSPGHLVSKCLIDSYGAPKPSFRDYLLARLAGRGTVIQEPRLIHLRDRGDTNYWHFLNDILGGRLRLAHQAGVSADVPLLLGKRALKQPFVQEILRDTPIGRRRLLIQDDEMVCSREVIHFETPRHSIEAVDFVLSCLGADGGQISGNKRVFLSRLRGSRRTIANLGDIEEVCRRWGFEVVEAEGMSVAEQIKLFSQVRHLVAIHGAGLTNIMFRRGAKLSLLEIFPATTYLARGRAYPPPAHYFWLSHACGFHYEAMFGESSTQGDFQSAFEVDPEALEMKIKGMLA
jgi:hypothetical protein